jgi:hypothetical protein
MLVTHQLILKMQFTFAMGAPTIEPMNRAIPCVLMRAGTSRGPFFLRDWLPADDRERDEALIGAIGASDLLQVDGRRRRQQPDEQGRNRLEILAAWV